MKYFEYRGIRGLVAAKVTKDDADGMEFGTPFQIAGVSELGKETEASSEPHYYDNIPAIVIESVGSDTVTMQTSGIDFKTVAEITGQVYDETKGLFVEGERENNYYALGYITKRTDGVEVFVWRLKGTFGIPSSTHITEDDGTDANGQELVYTGINTQHRFSMQKDGAAVNRTIKAVNVMQDVNPQNETTFFATVQTPDTITAPAAG